jgi:hypothetical protein
MGCETSVAVVTHPADEGDAKVVVRNAPSRCKITYHLEQEPGMNADA